MSITIKDVAKDAGCSLSTVSKYLNGGKLREKSKIKIEASIEKLHYFPNSAARGLRNNHTFTIGVFIPTFSDVYNTDVAYHLEKEIYQHNYSVLFSSYSDEEEIKTDIEMMLSFHVDGIIVVNTCMSEILTENIRKLEIPIVFTDKPVLKVPFDGVLADNVNGAYFGVKHLIDQKYQRIAIITGELLHNSARERYVGYTRALEDYGIPLESSLIYKGDYSIQSGYDGIVKLMDQENPPDAVFVSNVTSCEGVMSAIATLHIHSPGELGIVTFDDYDFSLFVKPNLTSVKQPIAEIAKESVELMIRRIEGDYSDYPFIKRIACTLIERKSSLKSPKGNR